jgi:hypothetical protein
MLNKMARRIGLDIGRYQDWKRIGWAWLLFLINLFFLWVAFNALFMLPGRYDTFVVSMAVVSIAIALLVAWASGKLFLSAKHGDRDAHNGVLSTPPMIVCIVMLLFFFSLLLLKAL